MSRGRLDPDARVTLRDWERWYYPADGAHAPALKRLRVRAQGNGTRTSAHDLVRLYDRGAAGSIADADVMRRHLQWQPASGDVAAGFKAGSLPGVLTVGMEQRVVGTKRRATGALLIGGLDEAMASSTDFGWQELLVEAMSDPTYARRVIATLGGTSSGTPGSTPTGPLVQTDLVR